MWGGGVVFAFLDFQEPTDYVYKIWLSLLKWPRFLFFDCPLPLILALENNIFVIVGSFYSIFHFSCFFSFIIIILIFYPLGRYAPESNQLLISMHLNYMSNLVLIFTLVFELSRPRKFSDTQTNRLTDILTKQLLSRKI